jgi:BASS family bile acid:Na+ symporter
MFGLMFAMGLTLTLDDFRRTVLLPGPTVVGTLLQLVGMPLAGLGLARAFALEPLLAAGLVIVAACPGGVMSNVLCHLGRADTALSITLTATATAITLFTIPLWVRAALASVGETGGHVQMPVLESALNLGGFTVLPVAIGMVLRPAWPGLAAHEPWITQASTAAIIVALAVEALRSEDPPIAAFAACWRPALLLLAAALAMGLGVPLLLKLGWREAATIAVELCIKNTVLGLFVTTRSLGSLEAGVPVAAFMTFQMPVGVGVLVLYNVWRRRQPMSEAIP